MSNQLLLRRRAMMSGKKEPGWDGKVWAYYEVDDVSSPTNILGSTTGIDSVKIEGVGYIPLATTYQLVILEHI